jgi:hypothetical protein
MASAIEAAPAAEKPTFSLLKDGDKLKGTFFSTRLGQYIVAGFLLIASVFALIAVCISLNFAHSLDQIQPDKQKATEGTAAFGIVVALGGIAGAGTWIYFVNKDPDVTIPDAVPKAKEA